MVTSLYVGVLLDAGRSGTAFSVAAGVEALGAAWIAVLARRIGRGAQATQSR